CGRRQARGVHRFRHPPQGRRAQRGAAAEGRLHRRPRRCHRRQRLGAGEPAHLRVHPGEGHPRGRRRHRRRADAQVRLLGQHPGQGGRGGHRRRAGGPPDARALLRQHLLQPAQPGLRHFRGGGVPRAGRQADRREGVRRRELPQGRSGYPPPGSGLHPRLVRGDRPGHLGQQGLMATHLTTVLWAGALLGFAYGAVAQWSRFCLLRGLLRQWSGQDGRLVRSFALALLVALLAPQALAVWADIDLNRSLYRQGSPALPLIFGGGLLFGIGMTLANACAARSLVLLGTGNLRSLAVLLVLGISAYMTLSGVLAPLRVALEQGLRTTLPASRRPGAVRLVPGIGACVTFAGVLAPLRVAREQGLRTTLPASSLPGLLTVAGVPERLAAGVAIGAPALALLAFCCGHRPFRASPR